MGKFWAINVVGGNKSVTNNMVMMFDVGVGWDETIVER
jgi:hypothetical protein